MSDLCTCTSCPQHARNVEKHPVLTWHRIAWRVAELYGVKVGDLASPRRWKRLVEPRYVAAWLARRITNLSTITLGRHLQRNHSVIVYAQQVIEKRRWEEPDLAARISQLCAWLGVPVPPEVEPVEAPTH